MSSNRKQWVTALFAGVLFGAGLVVGGMTDPRKVIGFLDLGGAWDPSLALVMLGAVAVHLLAYRWVRGSAAPLFAPHFAIPKLRQLDPRLIGGSALFGAGWGLAGYCPGPAITSLGAGSREAFAFVGAMFAGMFLVTRYDCWRAASTTLDATERRAARAR